MNTPDSHDNDMPSQLRDADARDRDHARELAETMTAAAFVLVERFGWSRPQLVAALDYELRECLQDAAKDDAAFREWYKAWRKENPNAG